MLDKLRILEIQFKNEIESYQIPLFRGMVINTLDSNNVLYHNHLDSGFRYSYPLIQYKRINRCAAIVCLAQGTDAIGEFFTRFDSKVILGDTPIDLQIQAIFPKMVLVQVWNDFFCYKISRWTPLNQENFQKYTSIESEAERYTFLENILVGNILSFAKGVGIRFDKKVICRITELEAPYPIDHKGIKMLAFNASFRCNVSIPEHIGIGKGASVGHGTIHFQKTRNQD